MYESDCIFKEIALRIIYVCAFIFLADDVFPLTLWVVADLETLDGRELVYSAIKHIVSIPDAFTHMQSVPSLTATRSNIFTETLRKDSRLSAPQSHIGRQALIR